MTPRPPLPFRHANPHIKQFDKATPPAVKYQVLNCQGQDILVGRIKINTPGANGHAFILRRFDTGAISLTTMFRAAFPSAPEADEKRETSWVRENYDLKGNNGSSKDLDVVRLAGTWVSPTIALELGSAYAFGGIIPAFVKASPDPNANYRRSAKSAAATPKATPSTLAVVSPTKAPLPSPPNAPALPNPPKRRREASPAQASPPRRSARTKSPAPKAAIAAFPTPKSPRPASRREEISVLTPAGSDETAVEEAADEHTAVRRVAGEELVEQDVAEQRALIAELRAERDAAKKQQQQSQAQEEDEEDEEETVRPKRAREEEDAPLTFNFKEPEVGERALVRNRRAEFRLEPQQRSAAWGVAAFAVGLSVMAFLPTLL